MNGKRSHNFRILTNCLAFFVLIVVAIILLLTKFAFKSSDLAVLLVNIAKYLTLAIVAMSSFWYVMSKRNVIVKIVWIVSLLAIVVLMFI